MLEMFSQQNASTFQYSLVWTNLWNIELQGEEKDKCQQILWPDLWHSKGSETTWELAGVVFFFVSTVRTWNYFKFQDMKRHFEGFLNFAVEGWLRPQLEAMGKSVIVHLMRWLQECQRTDLWWLKNLQLLVMGYCCFGVCYGGHIWYIWNLMLYRSSTTSLSSCLP